MGKFLEDRSAQILAALNDMADNTEKIVDALRYANQKTVDTSIHNHRIGALKRIDKAVEYIKEIRPLFGSRDIKKIENIENILLGR